MAHRNTARSVALAVAALLATRATAADGGAPDLLTLDQAVETALAANPGIRAATLAVQGDEEEIAGARSRYLPSLALQANVGKLLMPVETDFPRGAFGTLPGIGPVPGQDTTVRSGQELTIGLGATVMQPITQLYSARQGELLAEAGRESDLAQLAIDRAQLAAQVKRLYHQLAAAEGTLAAAVDQLESQRELARITSQQVLQQAALRSDELMARGAVASAALQVRVIEDQIATGKEQLNRLLGRDVRTRFRLARAHEQAPVDIELETARARALQARPELRQARLLVRKAELERRVKLWTYVPEVNVGVSYSSMFRVDGVPRNIAVGGVFARWDWDWGRAGHEATRQSLAAEEARARASDAAAAVLVEVGDAHRKLAEAREQVLATQVAVDALRARAPVVLNRYRLQAALLKDVLDVQAALTRATHDHEAALLSFWSAQADLERALGDAP